VEIAAHQVPLSLTFDDGPHPLWTTAVLRALERAHVTATFFVVAGAVRGAARMLRTIAGAGHTVELHCYRHIRHTALAESEIERDAAMALEVLAGAGVAPTMWRPPWGVCTDGGRRVAGRLGLELVGWDIDTHDWRGDAAEAMLQRVHPRLRGGGSVLMHDGLGPGARRHGCDNTVGLIGPLVRAAGELGVPVAPLAQGRTS